MPCSGCGATGHTPGDTHGHILGCGATKFNEDPRYSPFSKLEQENILRAALVDALSKSKDTKPDEPAFVTALAESLSTVLQAQCKE